MRDCLKATTTILREWLSEDEGSFPEVEAHSSYWTTERVLACIAGVAIGANATKEWREWRLDVENIQVRVPAVSSIAPDPT
jgi:hypothetical protein